jgi:amino acid permease
MIKLLSIIIIVLIILIVLYTLYRKVYPKTYNYDNCPNDHDTMDRFGFTGICDKCGHEFKG